jgi:transcriptional regulator with XRE-family HTH domain
MDDTQDLTASEDWQVQWGRLLRTSRQVAGMSLSELGAATGLSKGYLSKLESGHVAALNPSRATLAALARALPSFRALAHMLEPVSELGTLAFRHSLPRVPEIHLGEPQPGREPPVRLGWRELEVVVAFQTLERSAAIQPLTDVLIGRAVGRSASDVAPILESLVEMRVLRRLPAQRPGGHARYERAPDFETRVGIRRTGDALVLAAALLAQAPLAPRRTARPPVGDAREEPR